MGYHRAGFDVYSIDIVPRPNNPFPFLQADALEVLEHPERFDLPRPDAIHQSWPCQEANPLTQGTNKANGWGREHVQLIPRGRELAARFGVPTVIEQPVGSKMIRRDLMLCMAYFDLYSGKRPPWVIRHRDFELSGFEVRQPRHVTHAGRVRGMRHGVVHDGPYVAAYGNGGGKASIAEMQHALGIDWTDVREELTEAIPPAYTEYIGDALYRHIVTSDSYLFKATP